MMRFPVYLPPAVLEYLTTEINGSELSGEGWGAFVARDARFLSEATQKMEAQFESGDEDQLTKLRNRCALLKQRLDWSTMKLACLRRLGNDPRMREVYSEPTLNFSDEQWCNFISSAGAAREDYGSYRDEQLQAVAAAAKIAQSAASLGDALRKFYKTRVCGPSAFYYLPLNPDDPSAVGPSRSDFEGMADVDGIMAVLQRFGLSSAGATLEYDPEGQEIYERPTSSRSLPFSFDAMARAARQFRPQEYGMIRAAIGRQSNVKNEYLRAFASSLTEHYHFTLTPVVMQAMAVVATVVMHPRKVALTYRDVQTALA